MPCIYTREFLKTIFIYIQAHQSPSSNFKGYNYHMPFVISFQVTSDIASNFDSIYEFFSFLSTLPMPIIQIHPP